MRTLKSRIDWLVYTILVMGFNLFKLVEHSVELNLFWSGYFEDIIAIPVILKSSLLVLQLCRERYKNYVVKASDMIVILVSFSIYFEILLPQFDARFTSD